MINERRSRMRMYSENQTILSGLLDELGSGHSGSRSTARYRKGPLPTRHVRRRFGLSKPSPVSVLSTRETVVVHGRPRSPRRERSETCVGEKQRKRWGARRRGSTCVRPSGHEDRLVSTRQGFSRPARQGFSRPARLREGERRSPGTQRQRRRWTDSRIRRSPVSVRRFRRNLGTPR